MSRDCISVIPSKSLRPVRKYIRKCISTLHVHQKYEIAHDVFTLIISFDFIQSYSTYISYFMNIKILYKVYLQVPILFIYWVSYINLI